MQKKIAICPSCHTKITCDGEPGQIVTVKCENCGKTGSIAFKAEMKELDFYPLNEPYAYAKILKNQDTLEKNYKLVEPYLNDEEQKMVNILRKQHFINISELFRNTIRKTFEKFAIDNRKIIGK